MDTMMVSTTKTASFAQGNVEAVLESGKIWTEGVYGLSKSIAEITKAQLDDLLSTWRALGSVTSPQQALELQATLARNAFQKSIETSSRITEASMNLISRAMAPLTARATNANDTIANAMK